jgi:hypothetical protein
VIARAVTKLSAIAAEAEVATATEAGVVTAMFPSISIKAEAGVVTAMFLAIAIEAEAEVATAIEAGVVTAITIVIAIEAEAGVETAMSAIELTGDLLTNMNCLRGIRVWKHRSI